MTSSSISHDLSVSHAGGKKGALFTPFVDLAESGNSARAVQELEAFLERLVHPGTGFLDIHAGELVLTRRILTRMASLLEAKQMRIGTLFSTVPQTQQAALDEGYFVKNKPEPAATLNTLHNLFVSNPDFPDEESTAPELLTEESVADAHEAPATPPVSPEAVSPAVTEAGLKPESGSLGGVDIPQFRPAESREVHASSVVQDAPATVLSEVLSASGSVSLPAITPGGALLPAPQVMETDAQADIPAARQVLDAEVLATHQAQPSVQRTPLVEAIPELSDEAAREIAALPTRVIRQTLRSGQHLAVEGNLVVIGDLHTGSEVSATGDVVVWGTLQGIVHAGANGNTHAQIRAMAIEALQIRIGDFIARRPDRVSYHKRPQNNRRVMPEEARVVDGEIRIFKSLPDR
ncbi:MAG: septum site-determining protein MinC [Candidatus Melainabacteria bacterium]